MRLIEHGKVSKLFVSIYGDADKNENPAIIQRANEMAANRDKIYRGKKPLRIEFFDADSAQVRG